MKLLILLLSLCVTSLEAATITNWGAQLPTAVPASGDVILMQKGGVTYYFTPSQLSTFISTNISIGGTSNAIVSLNGSGTNTTFYGVVTGATVRATNLLDANNVMYHGATANGVTDDYASIQNALSYVGSIGGGTLYFPPGVYRLAKTLLIPGNVHVRGAGIGRTILRNSAAVVGVSTNGTFIYATLGAVAVTNIGIYDLTIDHQTHSTLTTSGITFRDANESFRGTQVENATVERVQVLLYNDHQYAIWFGGVKNGRIINCTVNGGVTSTTYNPAAEQEGIELGHVTDVLVQGNHVENMASWGINCFSPDGYVRGVRILGNYVTNCNIGIHCLFEGTSAPNTVEGILIADNIVSGPRHVGISFASSGVSSCRDVEIANNQIMWAPNYGISMVSGGTNSNFSVKNNLIQDTFSGFGYAVQIDGLNKVSVSGNVIDHAYHGLTFIASTNVDVRGNFVNDIIYNGVEVRRSKDVRILDNSFIDYGVGTTFGSTVFETPGVFFTNVLNSVVSRNEFRYGGTGETHAVLVMGSSFSTNVQLSFNQLRYNTNGTVEVFSNGSTLPRENILWGKVGVGTISPLGEVDIRGQTALVLANNDFVFGSSGSALYSTFGAGSGTTYAKIQGYMNGANGTANILLNPDGGFVGIGTVAQTATLDIAGNHGSYLFRVNTNELVLTNGFVGIATGVPTNTFDVQGHTSLRSNLFLGSITNVFTFGATNPPPVGAATPTKWISVRVAGESGLYRLPLYE